MPYDVGRIRNAFPALVDGAAHFDGPGGSQTPRSVADAVAGTLTSAVTNRGLVTASARRADAIVVAARGAMADLLGAEPQGIVFGRSMTALTFDMARTVARTWEPGDEVVVSRLDHDANIRPWVLAAAAVGATVRWVDFDPATGELPADAFAEALSHRTRLVAVTAASNLIGTRPDVAAITALAHRNGALAFVDAVHATAHVLPDLEAMGADLLVCSPYKFCGPHLGVLAGRPDVLRDLHPDKLLPSSDGVPERFELGTLPYELLAGTTAAVEFMADLARPRASRPRRARLATSYEALHEHELALRIRLERGLAEVGARVYARAESRTPTLLFDVPGHPSDEVQHRLAAAGVNAPAGSFYALEASRHLGLDDGGAVRVGLAPYTDEADVDRLLTALHDLTGR
jgi:cysteine desulfurase family protein (TIGR01976 family)